MIKPTKFLTILLTLSISVCPVMAEPTDISGTSPMGCAGESVGIRILKDGYTPADLTADNYSDILVYQDQTVSGADGRYSFTAETDGARYAYIGYGSTAAYERVDLAQPVSYFNDDFSSYGGGKGNFTYLSGDSSKVTSHEYGGERGRVMRMAANGNAALFLHMYADKTDMTKKLDSGVFRIAFDYCPAADNSTFVFRLLNSRLTSLSDSSQTNETFGVNGETKLGFYENAKGWTMHYPFILQKANTWYGVVMYVDFDLRRIVYCINGEYFGTSSMDDGFTSLCGFAVASPGGADVYLDNMSVSSVTPLYAAELKQNGDPSSVLSNLRTDIASGVTGNIFGSEPIKFTARYSAYSAEDDVTLTYTVLGEDGSTVWTDSESIASVTPGRVYTADILPAVDRYGLYTLSIKAVSGGTTLCDETVKFSKVNKPQSLNPRLGIVNHIAHNIGEYDKLTETESKAGFGAVRDELFWPSYETQKGVYKVPYIYDQYYSALRENNMELLQLFSATNSLYTTEYPPTSDGAIDAFANYAQNLCADLKGTTDYFEVWNEYNLSTDRRATPANYVKLAKAVAEKTREVNPNVKLVGACAAQLSGENKIIPWVTEFLNGGGGQYIDVLSIHIYCRGSSPEKAEYVSTVRALRSLLDSYGLTDMPIWMTETGWSPATNGIDDFKQAAYGVRANVLLSQDELIQKLFWYTSLKKYGASSDYEYDLGIMDDVRSANPYGATEAYLAFAAYNAVVGDREQLSLESDGGVYRAKYRDDTSDIYVVWADGTEADFTLDAPDGYGIIKDMYGNGEYVTAANGKITLRATDAPQYVILPDAPQFSTRLYITKNGSAVTADDTIEPGDEITVGIKALNTTDKTEDVIFITAVYSGEKLLRCEFDKTKVGGETKVYSKEFTVKADSADITAVKGFAWNNLGGMVPLADFVSITK